MTGHCIICSFDWPNYNCMANEEGSLPSSFLIANTDQRKSKCISPFSWYWSWELNKHSVHTCDLPFLSHEQWQFTPEQYFISISSTRLWQNCWMMTSHSSTWPLWHWTIQTSMEVKPYRLFYGIPLPHIQVSLNLNQYLFQSQHVSRSSGFESYENM